MRRYLIVVGCNIHHYSCWPSKSLGTYRFVYNIAIIDKLFCDIYLGSLIFERKAGLVENSAEIVKIVDKFSGNVLAISPHYCAFGCLYFCWCDVLQSLFV
ncbi:hypothetical protein Dsin_007544 [Dipteronia sinensis]|uniref:Uncharacterized protein n=1 Tax=Dipteronia sinensis TaxID=43782 RepID=A0AAE0B1M2_9ROSI|nr:hypothetical protein Dsin_007544 [Dipteronia sinensis]